MEVLNFNKLACDAGMSGWDVPGHTQHAGSKLRTELSRTKKCVHGSGLGFRV